MVKNTKGKRKKNTTVKTATKQGATYTFSIKSIMGMMENGLNYNGKHYIYQKAANQREQKWTKGKQEAILAQWIFWSNVMTIPASSDIEGALESAGGSRISNSLVTDIKITIDETPVYENGIQIAEGTFSIQDGEHRIQTLEDILDNVVLFPTKEFAIETNSYQKAFDDLYEEFGDTQYENLPKDVKDNFENSTVVLEVVVTNDQAVKSAFFAKANSGTNLTTANKMHNNFVKTPFWVYLNDVSTLIKADSHEASNGLISKADWEILHDRFRSSKNKDAFIPFLARNYAIENDCWASQQKMNAKFLLDNCELKDQKAKSLVKKMVKDVVQTLSLIDDKGKNLCTLYTANISILKSMPANKVNDIFKKKKNVNTAISAWFVDAASIDPTRNPMEIYSNTFHSKKNVIEAREELKDIYENRI